MSLSYRTSGRLSASSPYQGAGAGRNTAPPDIAGTTRLFVSLSPPIAKTSPPSAILIRVPRAGGMGRLRSETPKHHGQSEQGTASARSHAMRIARV